MGCTVHKDHPPDLVSGISLLEDLENPQAMESPLQPVQQHQLSTDPPPQAMESPLQLVQQNQLSTEKSNFIALRDLTLRRLPDFKQALVACPATTVCKGMIVTGEILRGHDGGEHLKLVVTTPPDEGSRTVYCFLPLHAYGKPQEVFLQACDDEKYPTSTTSMESSTAQLDHALSAAGLKVPRKPDRSADPSNSIKSLLMAHNTGEAQFVTLHDLTLHKMPDINQKLAVCDATTVKRGKIVRGTLVRGIDGGDHLKLVVATPPDEGCRNVYCFLPLHMHGEPMLNKYDGNTNKAPKKHNLSDTDPQEHPDKSSDTSYDPSDASL